MARVATRFVVSDLSSFARRLGHALVVHHASEPVPPGHLALQNLIARAAGYRNLQALKVAPSPPAAPEVLLSLSDTARRTLMQFDAEGRLVRWPVKFTVQRMAMWILWTRFAGKRKYTEREVNAILRTANAFDDHVTLRRELVNHRLLARESDCSQYWKLPARPDAEVRSLLAAWREGVGPRERSTRRATARPRETASAAAGRTTTPDASSGRVGSFSRASP